MALRPAALVILSLAVPAAPLAGQELVDGLREGESAWELAPAGGELVTFDGDWPWEAWIQTRFVDAFTGEPIEGVEVEGWTEDLEGELRLPFQVGRARSGRDGTAQWRFGQGQLRADKVIVRASGYRSTLLAGGDLMDEDVPLFPIGLPFQGRVLDLSGRPIAGAELRSKQTCIHAPPASVASSDAAGRFSLPDFPPQEHGPELIVSAPGYGSLRVGDPGPWQARAVRDGGVDVYLPRRESARVRVLSEEGELLGRRRVVNTFGEFYTWGWLGEDGWIEFPTHYFDRELGLQINDQRGEEWVEAFVAPAGLEATMRVRAEDQLDELPSSALSARLTIRFVGEHAERAQESSRGRPASDVQVFHEGGWFVDQKGEHRLPPGRVVVVAGRSFGGWVEERFELTLGADPVVLDYAPQPESWLSFVEPAAGIARLHVEAGGDSITREGRDDSVSVPPDVPVTILAECGESELRRVVLESVPNDAVIDFSRADTVLREELPWLAAGGGLAGRAVTVRVRAVDDLGLPVELAGSDLCLAGDWRSAHHEKSSEHVYAIPADMPWLVMVASAGRQRTWVRGEGAPAGETIEVVARVRRVADLRLEGPIVAAWAGTASEGVQGEGEERAVELDSLAPGPLLVRVEREDGRRLALELVLAPGEERVVRVR